MSPIPLLQQLKVIRRRRLRASSARSSCEVRISNHLFNTPEPSRPFPRLRHRMDMISQFHSQSIAKHGSQSLGGTSGAASLFLVSLTHSTHSSFSAIAQNLILRHIPFDLKAVQRVRMGSLRTCPQAYSCSYISHILLVQFLGFDIEKVSLTMRSALEARVSFWLLYRHGTVRADGNVRERVDS